MTKQCESLEKAMKSNDKQSQMAQLCREFAVEKAEIIENNDKKVCFTNLLLHIIEIYFWI